ncbi:MAG: AAA family ATPase [Bacteroidetes bacterium HGW-Bacteroidetes-8]|jgi:putative ATPase|nr:MAG: AAA family ATPase [Bacteroidetes bacterium HGW-Bacteroidetes-8]
MLNSPESTPLPERMRPKSLEDFVGQEHLIGEGSVLRKMIESGALTSFILWGPPGVGKTTLARIIANRLDRQFYALSAINSGVKDLREIIEKSRSNSIFHSKRPILFIDEIHRFSKSQQDALLGAVEDGTITLIGATTENPSFEVITPLLSRCQIYVLRHLETPHMDSLMERVLERDPLLSKREIKIEEREALYRFSGGDARKLLNIIEIITSSFSLNEKIVINNNIVTDRLQENIALYDKSGEQHYDIISAFIKSIRGSDPDAAVYWMARMLSGGEDPLFIARRMIVLSCEDIGLANPNALLIAQACFESVHKIGMPEARIVLSQAAIYLATSPKSNSSYLAIDSAMEEVLKSGDLPVPLHLRNAPTKLMKELNYGKDYKYAHSYPGNFTEQQFMPDGLSNCKFYEPGSNSKEEEIKKRLKTLWKKYNN